MVKLEGGGPKQSCSEGEAVPRNDMLFGNIWIPLATIQGVVLILEILTKSQKTLHLQEEEGRLRVS